MRPFYSQLGALKMQMSMTFQVKKVTRHVGEWILNTYSPTAYFGRIGEWASGYPQHWYGGMPLCYGY
jgi:hypothetical protein